MWLKWNRNCRKEIYLEQKNHKTKPQVHILRCCLNNKLQWTEWSLSNNERLSVRGVNSVWNLNYRPFHHLYATFLMLNEFFNSFLWFNLAYFLHSFVLVYDLALLTTSVSFDRTLNIVLYWLLIDWLIDLLS